MTDPLDIPALRAEHDAGPMTAWRSLPGELYVALLDRAERCDELEALIDTTADHWLALQIDHPIAWEGAVDEAMRAGCDRIRELEALNYKFMWQVRDTCARAEKAEAEIARLRADNAQIADLLDCALDEYEGHNGRRKATPEYAHWSVSARAALKGGDDD